MQPPTSTKTNTGRTPALTLFASTHDACHPVP